MRLKHPHYSLAQCRRNRGLRLPLICARRFHQNGYLKSLHIATGNRPFPHHGVCVLFALPVGGGEWHYSGVESAAGSGVYSRRTF